MEIPINYLAVVAAAAASIVLGSLWYGPLFGKQWMALMGFTQHFKTPSQPPDRNVRDERSSTVQDLTADDQSAGFTPEHVEAAKQKGMAQSYALMALGSLVMSYVLAHALVFGTAYTEVIGIAAGLTVGFWNWLGFIAPVTLSAVIWEGKPWKLWLLNNGYYIVSLLIMGVILAVW